MFRIKKFKSKVKVVYTLSAVAATFGLLTIYPAFSYSHGKADSFYKVTLNGETIGSVAGRQQAYDALAHARLRVNAEAEGLTCIEQDMEIEREKGLIGNRLSDSQLEDKMYRILKDADEPEQDLKDAYVVNIDDYTVTLRSKDDVVKLLNAAKSTYDTENSFQIDLVREDTGAYSYMKAVAYRSSTEVTKKERVMATNGVTTPAVPEETKDSGESVKDGITDISFAENIQVLETYTDSDKITDIDTAIEEVTKEKEENETYVVEEGDCLSSIAEKYDLYMAEILGMNPGLTADSVIGIGDLITVTVPKPELSVIVTKQMTYEESYEADEEYVYNDNLYTTDRKVLSEGTTGYRQVKAKVVYENNAEISREIVEESVITPATPKVIEVGTIVPPTFIKPLAGGRFSSGFGRRWGTMHKGVDWACPIGTAINASCDGKVVTAGWVRGYGYLVEIAHSNGMHTRYGHLSQMLVSVGESVSQGEKVALSGNTGDSTGPHVHFEIIVNGSQVNPLDYLN